LAFFDLLRVCAREFSLFVLFRCGPSQSNKSPIWRRVAVIAVRGIPISLSEPLRSSPRPQRRSRKVRMDSHGDTAKNANAYKFIVRAAPLRE